MSKIIPRWEWRTFGDDFSKGEDNIIKYGNSRDRKSSEIYILSSMSNDVTRIRDELMDLKSPVRINKKTRLVQWTALEKSSFPIPINDLALVFKAFELKMPYLDKDEYPCTGYLEELIGNNPELMMVNVDKFRHGYLIDEAIVEITEARFNEYSTRTIAVEHTDPELILAKKKELTGYENIYYIQAKKRAFGMTY
ncbi:MAG: hypothetical protein JW996_07535 [Candidatus Cloacimonetes bacterium]|nr:hypothetical protein [Candidatus Cloacimonadota bacterium]